MTTTTDEVRLLTPAEAANALAISISQLDQLVKAKVVTPVRLTPTGNRRLRVADLAALVNETTTQDD